MLQRRRHHGIGARAGFQRDGIEETLMAQRKAEPRSRITGHPRQQAHTLRDARQTLRPMPHRIHAGHDSQQHLRGADIGSRLFAADMLFARLQRQPHRRRTGGIHGNTNKPPRHQALMRIRHRHEGSMRPAIAHRHAKTLRTAHHHIGAHFARRLQQSQRKRISRDNRQATHRMHGGDLPGQVAHFARGAGILQHQREGFLSGASRGNAGHRRHHYAIAKWCRAGFQHSAGLRVQISGQHNYIALGPRCGMGQRHGFRHRSRLIQERRIGNRQAGQIRHHGLEIHQGFQAPLRDFRLIGRVGRVPAGIFQDVAQDHRRRQRAMIAKPDQGFDIGAVLLGQGAQFGNRLGLAHRRRQGGKISFQNRGRHGACGKLLKAARADHLQHFRDLGFRWPDMAPIEGVMRFKRNQFSGAHARLSTKE